MKRIFIPFPTMWDRPQLDLCRTAWQDRFEVVYGEVADAEVRWNFDYQGWLARALTGRADGVFSSSDYPGAIAAAEIANARKLPGSDPAKLVTASHKFRARQMLQDVAPVKFALIDPEKPADPPFGYPCFVKPVRGTFSMHTRLVKNADELRAFMASPGVREFRAQYVQMFNSMWARHVGDGIDGRYFMAEEPLSGAQVTVEGLICQGKVTVFGVVDSELHPRTGSFTRFVYPSRLPQAVQQQMHDVAARAVVALGLDNTLFNLEMFWSAEQGARIIEVNPRMCGQFGDLYLRVDGRSSYEAALELSSGRRPIWPHRQGRSKVASSKPLRVLEPVRVTGAPDSSLLLNVAHKYDALIWNETTRGDVMADFTDEDGYSFRYAVINLGADSEQELLRRTQAAVAELGWRFEPLDAA